MAYEKGGRAGEFGNRYEDRWIVEQLLKLCKEQIAGILWEHAKRGEPMNRNSVDKALNELYGQQPISDISKQLLDDIFKSKKTSLR
ncbi:MAG: hypothetical protein FWD23_06220 [Oscillospiraceae bacterium]|nr:hypothetical protein [Oscillospiraceae bacterium]